MTDNNSVMKPPDHGRSLIGPVQIVLLSGLLVGGAYWLSQPSASERAKDVCLALAMARVPTNWTPEAGCMVRYNERLITPVEWADRKYLCALADQAAILLRDARAAAGEHGAANSASDLPASDPVARTVARLAEVRAQASSCGTVKGLER